MHTVRAVRALPMERMYSMSVLGENMRAREQAVPCEGKYCHPGSDDQT